MITTKRFRFAASVALGLCLAVAVFFYVPPPHEAQAQFGSQREWGGIAGGTGFAMTLTVPGYNGQPGIPLRFLAPNPSGFGTTLNVNSLGAVQILRITNVGNLPLVGGEINPGQAVEVIWNGGNWLLLGHYAQVGQTAEFRGSVPTGWLTEDGRCVARTGITAALFAAQGSKYGACDGSTTFALADPRGRFAAAPDNQGINGVANRITSGVSGCSAADAVACGAQSFTLTSVDQLPPNAPAGTIGDITPAGTIGDITPSGTVTGSIGGQGGGVIAVNNIGPANASVGAVWNATTLTWSGSFTGNPVTPVFTGNPVTPVFTGNSVGSSAPIVGLMPVQFTVRAVKL